MLPVAPHGPVGASPSSVTVSGAINGSGPQVLQHKRRISAALRGKKALSFSSIAVSATIYPGYAGAVPITNTTSIAPPSGSTYAATVTFANVPAGNNEWVLMTFTGIASDKSQYALGELLGVVNVSGSTANTATLTTTTTTNRADLPDDAGQRHPQHVRLTNTTTLASSIATGITNSHVAADAGTGSSTTAASERSSTRSRRAICARSSSAASPELVGSLTLVRDYTSTPELNAESNVEQFAFLIGESLAYAGLGSTADDFLEILGTIDGGPYCGGFSIGSSAHTPPSGTVIPGEVSACTVPFSGTGTTVKGVYGGAIILGLTTNLFSYSGTPGTVYNGGNLKVAGRAVGSAAETVPTGSTSLSISVTDPAAYAGQVYPSFSISRRSERPSTRTRRSTRRATSASARVTIPTPYSSHARTR